ncbi:MAG: choice-of-anchor N protein [Candidatus Krumholzibacteriia bacterium]
MKRITTLAVMSIFLLIMAGNALAVPRLQTYIVGSTYERFYQQESDSWITHSNNFDLKVVGYWNPASGGGSSSLLGHGQSSRPYDFMDTYLMVSTPIGQSGTVWINGVEMTEFEGYWSVLPNVLDPNPSLRNHMPAGMGRYNFQSIGRIDNDEIKAYDYSSGAMSNPGWGDEILLDIVVSGYSWAHFDAAGVNSKGRTYTNPYSHDASYYSDNKAIPEPGTLSLLGLGLLGMIPILRRKRG